MYKNVLNQGIVVLIILFGLCFSAFSQTMAANTPATSTSADNKSDHPPAASTLTSESQETVTAQRSVSTSLFAGLPSFMISSNESGRYLQ